MGPRRLSLAGTPVPVVEQSSAATTLPNEGAAVGQQQVQYTIQVYPPPRQGS